MACRFEGARRAKLTLLIALSLAGSASCAGGGRDASVLLVTFDTTRADRIGCYGRTGAGTPTLDGLAARGVRFDRAYATAPITLPSHASILTGAYPPYHGVRDNGLFVLGPEVESLAEVFQRNGYATGAFISAFPLYAEFGLDRGFDLYDDEFEPTGSSPGRMEERSADVTVASAKRWLSTVGDDRAFFAWLHLFDPHDPYEASDELARRFDGDLYQAEISFADAMLGDLLAHLEELGRLDDTIVAATADHGEALGEHGEATHAILLYDGTMRVPLVLAGPGVAPAAGREVVYEDVSLVDVAPTLAELAALDDAGELFRHGGASLVTCWGASEGRGERDLYFETLYPRIHHGWSELVGIARGGWKYVEAPGVRDARGTVRAELFEVSRDPAEAADLSGAREDVARDLAARLADLRERVERGAPGGNRRALESGDLEALAALGYGGADVLATGTDADAAAPAGDPRALIEVVNLLNGVRYFVSVAQFEPAKEDLDALLQLDPDGVAAHEAAGEFYFARGVRSSDTADLERAVEGFAAAARMSPGRRGLWFRHGTALRALGRFDEALVSLERAVALAPPTPRILEARDAVRALVDSSGE